MKVLMSIEQQHLFNQSFFVMMNRYHDGTVKAENGSTAGFQIDRKPENGCEIQNAACGKGGVMIRLKFVKTKETGMITQRTEDHDKELNHGAEVSMKMIVTCYFFRCAL